MTKPSVTTARAVPVDPALPALEDLLPEGGAPEFLASFASEFAGERIDPASAMVTYVRYRPKKSVVAGWSFERPGEPPLLVSARAFHNDRATKLLSGSSVRDQVAAASRQLAGTGAPFRYLPERRLLLQMFPFDLRLPQLVLAADGAWLRSGLRVNGSPRPAPEVIVEAASYKPWRRCVFRYASQMANAGNSYYGKLFRDDRGERLLSWHRVVNESLHNVSAPWSLPEPVAYLPDAKLLLFSAVEGATKVRRLLRPTLKDAAAKDQLLTYIAAAATGLASFQRSELKGLRAKTPQYVVDDFRRDCEGIDAVAGGFFSQIVETIDLLDTSWRSLPPEPLVLTHGAFRHDQLLESGGKLVVLDLDTVCLSGESADAGNFLGYLDLTGLRRPRLQSVIEACAATFSESVQAAGITTPAWTSWYRAAAHVKKALRSFFALEPAWPQTSAALLDLAETTLRDGRAA
jgi:hypothetical protein